MTEYCSICGSELITEEEIERGTCINCDTTLIHDAFEGEQLFDF